MLPSGCGTKYGLEEINTAHEKITPVGGRITLVRRKSFPLSRHFESSYLKWDRNAWVKTDLYENNTALDVFATDW